MAGKTRIGAELFCAPDLRQALDAARQDGLDFACSPLSHPRNARDARGVSERRAAPETRSDLALTCGEWSRLIVGTASAWPRLDASCAQQRRDGEAALTRELEWASHLSLAAVLLPPLPADVYPVARRLQETFQRATSWQAWVRCRLVSREEEARRREDPASSGDVADPWLRWDRVRRLCDHSAALCVALELTETLPSVDAARRWRGEPLKCVLVPYALFRTNEAGFPVLPKAHQDLLASLAKLEPQLCLTGVPTHPRQSYVSYLRHLIASRAPVMDEAAIAERPYRDYLQAPLQPLADNLEANTYETFERDPVKYARYEEAVKKFLGERTSAVVVVAGAGRGPLVAAVLRAASDRCNVKVHAVEKNANAIVTLRHRASTEDAWRGRVEVHQSDMRRWAPPCPIDCVVSELLGSFGDNELSPECLEPVERWTSTSIPQNYESFLQPISCARLWFDARRANTGLPAGPPAVGACIGAPPPDRGLETPFVVKLHNFAPLSAVQPAFRFDHPASEKSLERYCALEFPVAVDCTVHGLAGYFESELYDGVMISINPATFSTGMFSWFPLFLPFSRPVFVAAGSSLVVRLWRRREGDRVWYEWAVVGPDVLPVHNPGGRSCAMRL